MVTLSSRLDRVIESQTLAMTKKARELKEKGNDVISLSIGEPDFDTPINICNEATEAMSRGETHYPPVLGTLAFRQAIQNKLLKENGLDYTTSQIIVSNGAKQSLFNAIMALVNPGDEVIIPAPYWVSYPSMVNYAQGKVVEIATTVDENYLCSADKLESAITDKTKLIIFSSPCNPSGSVIPKLLLDQWVEVLHRHPQVFVISDEIYERIVYDEKPVSIASYPGMKDRVAVVNGLAKGFAMTGWRIGYLAGPQELVSACERFQGMVSSGANSIAQAAGIEALQGDQSEVEKMRQTFEERRNLMHQELSKIEGIKLGNPEGAFYHFPDVSYYFGKKNGNTTLHDADELCLYLLESALVALVSGAAFGAPNCIRLSYATSDANIIEACSRIKKALESLN